MTRREQIQKSLAFSREHTQKERPKRSEMLLTYDGVTKSAKEWAMTLGVSYDTLAHIIIRNRDKTGQQIIDFVKGKVEAGKYSEQQEEEDLSDIQDELDENDLIDICLNCTKESCSGECARINAAQAKVVPYYWIHGKRISEKKLYEQFKDVVSYKRFKDSIRDKGVIDTIDYYKYKMERRGD